MAKSNRGPATRPKAGSSGPAGQSGGTGAQRPGGSASRTQAARRPPQPKSRRPLLIAVTAGVVVIAVVVALVVVKVTGSSTTTTAGTTPAPADVVNAVSTIPVSTFEAVGTGSGLVPPKAIKNQPTLLSNSRPEVFYAGGEFCPYCAAERWALVAGLSRFGTFSNLKQTESSTTDVYPGTKTFSFYGSSYTSPYIVFTPLELYSNQKSSSAQSGYTTLQTPTSQQQTLISKYDQPPYSQSTGGIPFIDFGNKYVTQGASYSPQILQGLSMGTIAGSLRDPSTTPAQNVDAQANIIAAMVCQMTNGQPASVCSTAAVKKAESSLPATS